MADPLARRKFQSIARLMRDGQISASARLVGWELYERMNKVTREAWPSQETMAAALGLNIKTVKRAVAQLKAAGYIRSRRDGQFNRYAPSLVGDMDELELASDESEQEQGTKTGRDRGQKGAVTPPVIGDKNGPEYPSSRNPSRTSSATRPTLASDLGMPVRQPARKEADRLRDQRGDEQIERKAIDLLSRDGIDGFEILSRLHEVDRGQPRLRLLRLIRDGTLTDRDLASARLAAMTRERVA